MVVLLIWYSKRGVDLPVRDHFTCLFWGERADLKFSTGYRWEIRQDINRNE